MRRKKLIFPEQPTQDGIKSRFKLLFLPYVSYLTAATILTFFICAFIALIRGTITKHIILDLIFWLSYIVFVPSVLTYLLKKIADTILYSEGMSGLNIWGGRKHTGWQEITLIKPYQILGMRCLSIETASGENIQFPTRLYETAKILDRVRELAGEEHILVRALEKELSRPRYELTKLWTGVIGTIALTVSIYLIGGNMYAAEQEKPLEQAIATYVRQHPKTAPNQSAIELQALITKLGLSVEAFGDGSEVKVKPDKAAIAEWNAIEPVFKKYLDKQQKSKESIEPISANLENYLKTHQADIEAIENYLVDNPIPQWGSDSGWVEKSDPKAGDSPFSKWINGFHLLNTQNILIVNILDKQRSATIDISRNLAAIERIQQSFQAQPSLVGQLYPSSVTLLN